MAKVDPAHRIDGEGEGESVGQAPATSPRPASTRSRRRDAAPVVSVMLTIIVTLDSATIAASILVTS